MRARYLPLDRTLLIAFKAVLATLWVLTGAAAYGAVKTEHIGLGLDPMLALLTLIISTLSGATALAWRINDLMVQEDVRVAMEGGERRPFFRPWLFSSAHMGGSWMGGALAFFFGNGGSWDVWNTLGFVLVLSFMGSKGIEMIAERWLGSVALPGAGPGGGGGPVAAAPLHRVPLPKED